MKIDSSTALKTLFVNIYIKASFLSIDVLLNPYCIKRTYEFEASSGSKQIQNDLIAIQASKAT